MTENILKTLISSVRERRWGIALACFLGCSVAIGGSQYSFGHFVEPIKDSFGWSTTQVTFSLSMLALGNFISPFVGMMIDRYGSRNIMSFSLAVFGFSYLARVFMSGIWHWYFLSIVQALTVVGSAALPPGKLIGMWFPQNRGKVLGVTVMGNNFGGMAIQPLVAFLVSLYSWKMGYAVIGILGILVSIYSFFIVRNPVETLTASSNDQESLEITPASYTLGDVLKMRSFYAIVLGVVCGSFTYSALLPQVSHHLIENGVTQATAAVALSLFATCGMAGKFLFGMFSDRYGAKLATIIDLAGQAVFAALLVYAGNGIPIWLIVPFMGFFFGAYGALYNLLVLDSFGVKHFGTIMGFVSIAIAVPAFVGPIIAGQSFDQTGSYATAFFITAAIFAMGASVLVLVRTNETLPSR